MTCSQLDLPKNNFVGCNTNNQSNLLYKLPNDVLLNQVLVLLNGKEISAVKKTSKMGKKLVTKRLELDYKILKRHFQLNFSFFHENTIYRIWKEHVHILNNSITEGTNPLITNDIKGYHPANILKIKNDIIPRLNTENALRFWSTVIKNEAFQTVLPNGHSARELAQNFINKISNINNQDKENLLFQFFEDLFKKHPQIIREIDDLNLSDAKLFKIPSYISLFQNLVILDLSENYIKVIPPEIGALTQLLELNLLDNKIEIFPIDVCRLTQLEDLNISFNQIKEIPPEIGALTHLEELNLSFNQIETIPLEFRNLIHLLNLNLMDNKIIDFSVICNLTLLENINLSTNLIKDIPHEIKNLVNLQVLSLKSNVIKSIPDELSDLGSLEELFLHRNLIENVPSSLFRLSRLEILNLSFNMIKMIPSNLSSLPSFTSIKI